MSHFCAFVESAWGGAGFPLRPFLSPTELGPGKWVWRFAFDYLGGGEPAVAVCEVAAAGGFTRDMRMTTGTPDVASFAAAAGPSLAAGRWPSRGAKTASATRPSTPGRGTSTWISARRSVLSVPAPVRNAPGSGRALHIEAQLAKPRPRRGGKVR